MATPKKALVHFFLDISVFILVLFQFKAAASATTAAEALLKWKNSLSSPSPSLNSWSLKNITNLCQWHGIHCDDSGSVSQIDLSEANLAGTLDLLDFNSFPNLTSFNLSENAFNGAIPAALGVLSGLQSLDLSNNLFEHSIPPEIGNLTELRYISFFNNYIVGKIPYQIGNLQKVQLLDFGSNYLETPDWSRFPSFPSLTHLSFYYNHLTMGFPDFIATCLNLTYLDLADNIITGEIPPSLGLLRNLEYLDLRKNAFTSSIPQELGHCTNLTYLALGINPLMGPLPLSLFNLTKLYLLNLANTSLSGELPPEIGLLKNLNYLILHNSSFSGSIPPQIGKLQNLLALDLSQNQFSGEIPPVIGNLTNLTTLYLYLNNLSGGIPAAIGDLTLLEMLDLSDNPFGGQLPDSMSALRNLELLYLQSNNLSGILPQGFGENSPGLAYVSFSSNSFSGMLPQGLCSGFALVHFTVNDNMLSGLLPECFKNCSSLTRVRLEGNRFSGNIEEAFGIHPQLTFLSISNNQFTGKLTPNWGMNGQLTLIQMDHNNISGEIPAELGNLTQLRVLALDSNKLTGAVPDELGKLEKLFKLNLCNNQLNGEIPQSIGQLTALEYLDLSGNKLTMSIPLGIGNCKRLLSLNLSNNFFSGSIPTELGELTWLRYLLDLSNNSLSGMIPSSLGRLISLEILNLSHNNLSGKIPEALSEMKSLSEFSFSNNKLSGPIPSGDIFSRAPAKAFAENSGLCGEAEGLPLCGTTTLSSKSGNKGKIIVGATVPVASLIVLAMIMVGLVVLQKKKNIEDPESHIWEAEWKIPFGEIVRATEDFSEKHCIGRGGVGSVYRADIQTGQIIAVKVFNTSVSSDVPITNLRSFQNEIRSLIEARHRNIIKLYGYCSTQDSIYLVYEYIERGSLRKVLYEDVELDWPTRVKIVQGVAHALAYLHCDCSAVIVHRDVSTSNILLDSDFEPRLSDFGTARLLASDSSNWTTAAGTYGYMAPDEGGRYGEDAFTKTGFCNWKKALEKFNGHIGATNSCHNYARVQFEAFQDQRHSVTNMFRSSSREIEIAYRLRLIAVLDVTRFLLKQGLPFRGHDESTSSINRGNFLELLEWYTQHNIAKVLGKNAPCNNQMTSPKIQKELAHACASKITLVVVNEIGDNFFTLLVDEARDVSMKEQMGVVLRYVNKKRCVIERFLAIVHVNDTSSCSLKDAIDVLFVQHGLSLSKVRGQGYDGASNMRGEFNGLKSLVLQENPCAMYVHYFSHQLQLIIIVVAKRNTVVIDFFNYVVMIVNTTSASCKRRDRLTQLEHERIVKELNDGERQSGRGQNQETILVRPCETRWGTHYLTLLRLCLMWPSIESVLENVRHDATSLESRSTAEGLIQKWIIMSLCFCCI